MKDCEAGLQAYWPFLQFDLGVVPTRYRQVAENRGEVPGFNLRS
jgi:hypothetical protein